MKTSVLVPTYNRASLLAEALDSLCRQTRPVAQILVVDDGSQDATQSVAAAFPGVEYLFQPNAGKSAAINRGLSRLHGELVWIFDDDDIAVPQANQWLAAALERHPAAGFAYGSCDSFTRAADGAMQIGPGRKCPAGSPNLVRDLLYECSIFQPGLLVRRACYQALGAFNEEMLRAQDYEMLLRLARRFDGVGVDQIVFHQRQHRAARGTSKLRIGHVSRYRIQTNYDQAILKAVYATYSPQEYLPEHPREGAIPAARQVDALIERAVIMGRRGLWSFFAQDMDQVLDCATRLGEPHLTAPQRSRLATVLDKSSVGLPELCKSAELRAFLSRAAADPMVVEVRAALCAPLLARVAMAIRDRKPHLLACLLASLLYLSPTAPHLASRAGRRALSATARLRLAVEGLFSGSKRRGPGQAV